MKLSHDGVDYRIGFQHERPRNWDAHVGHKVALDAEGFHCEKCHVNLGNIGPSITRKLKSLPVGKKTARNLVARELARNVHCTIYQREGEEWKALYTGHSHLNTDAGDQYDRERGRLAALRNALPKPEPVPVPTSGSPDALSVQVRARLAEERNSPIREFRRVAMAAYLNRPHGAAAGAGKAH